MKGATSESLFVEPNENSEVIREIPLGDIVQYPAQDLAPAQADDWIWVRHDVTQERIWSEGTYGWMKPESIMDVCG
jgi:hypothetical protein